MRTAELSFTGGFFNLSDPILGDAPTQTGEIVTDKPIRRIGAGFIYKEIPELAGGGRSEMSSIGLFADTRCIWAVTRAGRTR